MRRFMFNPLDKLYEACGIDSVTNKKKLQLLKEQHGKEKIKIKLNELLTKPPMLDPMAWLIKNLKSNCP